MRCQIPYGKDQSLPLEIPEERLIGIYAPQAVEVEEDGRVLEAALAMPLGAPTLADFLGDTKDILFLINDGTRPTPTARVLAQIEPWLVGRHPRFLIATGTHRASTVEERQTIFGALYERYREQIIDHDAHHSEMISLGLSSRGTPFLVNRLAMEAEKLVIIGSVEPHYFAGYTGGRKAFVPGVAGYETIEKNHRFAMYPEAAPLRLAGNPIHEDMEEALAFLDRRKIYSIQLVLDDAHRIYAATAGDIHDSFHAAIAKAHEVYCVEIPEKADIVIAVAPYPMDIDLYQSQKAFMNGWLALKEGGAIFVVSDCRNGIGGRAFFDLMSAYSRPEEVFRHIEGSYRLGYHKAAKIAELVRYGELWFYSSLEASVLEKVFMRKIEGTLQAALDEALARFGEAARVLVLLGASLIVPKLRDENPTEK